MRHLITWGNMLRLFFCTLLLAWVVWGIPWQAVGQNLQHLSISGVGLVVLAYVGTLLLKLVRWQWYLRLAGLQVGWLTAARAYFTGQAVNIIGVGRFGEAARIAALTAENREITAADRWTYGGQITATVFAEKLMDVFSLGVATLLCFGVLLQPTSNFRPIQLLMPLAASIVLLLATLVWGQRGLAWMAAWLLRQHWLPARAKFAHLAQAFGAGLQVLVSPRSLLTALGFNSVIWLSMLGTDMLMLSATRLPVRWQTALTVVVVGHFGVATNLTPSNLGIFHWAVQTALAWNGVPVGQAVAYAVAFHLVVSATPVLLASLFNGEQLWAGIRAKLQALARNNV